MNGSYFDRPWFYPAAIAILVAGHAFDLFGTYVYQPHFEHEVNPIYLTLRPYGLTLNWPMVLTGKTLICLLSAWGLYLFLRRQRLYYPRYPATFRELITHFIYGRPLGWIESGFRLPRSVVPTVLTLLAAEALSGPYLAYLGYGNLASKYGWWQPGGFWAGRYWIDWAVLIWVPLVFSGLGSQLWRDFQDAGASGITGEAP